MDTVILWAMTLKLYTITNNSFFIGLFILLTIQTIWEIFRALYKYNELKKH